MNFRMSAMAEGILVVEVEDRDTGPVVDRLSKRNHGYAIRGTEMPVAVIDKRLEKKKWCTPDHLLAIEAHELGHILADTDDEPTAEAHAILLLEQHGHTGAAQLLRDRGLA